MANEMRDRLVELIRNTRFIKCVFCKNNGSCESDYCKAEIIADHLIENGVVVPPCKVGDTVWVISQWYKYTKPEIESRKILSVQFYRSGAIQYHYKDGCFWREYIGKTVFLTKSEAEQKLKEMRGE